MSSKRKIRPMDVLGGRDADATADPELVLRLRHECAHLRWRGHGIPECLQGGRFGQWMFWAAVMLTLPQILSWFSGFGMNVLISAGGGTAFLNVFKVEDSANGCFGRP